METLRFAARVIEPITQIRPDVRLRRPRVVSSVAASAVAVQRASFIRLGHAPIATPPRPVVDEALLPRAGGHLAIGHGAREALPIEPVQGKRWGILRRPSKLPPG